MLSILCLRHIQRQIFRSSKISKYRSLIEISLERKCCMHGDLIPRPSNLDLFSQCDILTAIPAFLCPTHFSWTSPPYPQRPCCGHRWPPLASPVVDPKCVHSENKLSSCLTNKLPCKSQVDLSKQCPTWLYALYTVNSLCYLSIQIMIKTQLLGLQRSAAISAR